ncbi:alpha/beta hydrolase [Mycolicibacterium sediminis]|uniref:Alpha/beta hydrolase n=1 Tax=Mycolicibacterium sediminis TaxID=1286180 RepID=A0A7I7QM86_9MYCO|nr:alpha/beta hydrolase [Mycolicibacterium sediminis]BBY27443.1 hypothetical protein MSEDJ_15390 [Mycolicibacterium sediminis]
MLRNGITGDLVNGFNTPTAARRVFFSSATAESDVVRYSAKLCNDSQLVAYDALRPIAHPERVTTPVLVLGAQLDAVITLAEITATAKAYGSDAEVFPDMGHNMMLEPGLAAVAERIDTWVSGQG